jgi:hypothetical protein
VTMRRISAAGVEFRTAFVVKSWRVCGKTAVRRSCYSRYFLIICELRKRQRVRDWHFI